MHKSNISPQACCSTLALLVAGAFATHAQAQTTPPTSENPTVVIIQAPDTAPPTPPLTSQYSEGTITAETLRNQSDEKSLQTMLVDQPSIFAYQNGPNGVGANIFFRGFDSGEFAETFDGVSINDIFNGGVTGEASTWNSVLFIPSNVDSVELTRGINNPATNSYNSLGGTIDFLPRMPTQTAGVSAGVGYGSFNSYSVDASVNTGNLGGLKQTFAADYRKSDGWIANTPDQNTNLYYAGRYDTDGNALSLIAVYDQNKGSEPLSMPVPLLQANGKFYQYPTSVDNQTAKDDESMVILDDKAVLSPSVVFDNKVFAGTQDFRRTSYGNPADANSPYELPDQAEDYNYWIYYPNGPTYNPKTAFGSDYAGTDYHFYGYQSWAIGYSTKMIVSLPHNTVTVGGNVTYGKLTSDEFWYGSAPVPQVVGYDDAWDEHDSRLLGSLYVQDEIKLLNDTLSITPGLKYIYAKTQDTDSIGFFYPYGGTDGNNDHFVSPTIGLNYKASEHLAFNAAFGQNIKLPDIASYYNQVPGTTSSTPLVPPKIMIKPEHVNDYELGARYSDGDLALSIDGYREDFSSIFVDSFNPATYETNVTNGGTARFQGVELQLADGVHFNDGGYLKGFINYAYNQATYTSSFNADAIGVALSDSDTAVHAGERMPDVPETLLSVGATYLKDGYRLDLMARYIGSQVAEDTATGTSSNSSIPGYTIVDLGLSKTFIANHSTGLNQNIKLSLYVDNLFNKYYYNTAYTETSGTAGPTEFATPGAPRSIMAKIDYSF